MGLYYRSLELPSSKIETMKSALEDFWDNIRELKGYDNNTSCSTC